MVAEAADGAAGRRGGRCGHRPDVVLMDIRMPEMDGLEATRRILAAPAGADCRIIMLTTFDLDQYVYAALTAGRQRLPAQGRLARAAGRRGAHGPLRRRPAGAVHHPPARRAVRAARRGPPAVHGDLSELTPRELEVLRLLARGLSNAELAAQLTLSEATVKTHVGRILAKLQLRDRVQAVVLAYETGLVGPGHDHN